MRTRPFVCHGCRRVHMIAACSLLLVILGAGSASAAPIAVNNPSFEVLAPDVNPGFWGLNHFTVDLGCPSTPLDGRVFTSDPIVGWVEGTACRTGTFRPSAFSYNPGAQGMAFQSAVGIPDGTNVAFLAPSTMISQVLGVTLTSGLDYLLTVEIGDRWDTTLSTFEIRLLAGNATLASTSSASPPNGGFATATVSFLAPNNHPNLGDPLQIQIANTGSSGQLNVDSVSLVPEPSTSPLLALGIAGLAITARNRSDRGTTRLIDS